MNPPTIRYTTAARPQLTAIASFAFLIEKRPSNGPTRALPTSWTAITIVLWGLAPRTLSRIAATITATTIATTTRKTRASRTITEPTAHAPRAAATLVRGGLRAGASRRPREG